MEANSFTMDCVLNNFLNPSMGLSWLNLNSMAPVEKLMPLTANPAKIAPARRAAKMGQMIIIEFIIFV